MSDAAGQPENRCYRHPDRETYIRCQRCGRPVCAECQTQAAVGVHCPECVREARASAPRTTPRFVNAIRHPAGGTPVVTYALVAINVVIWLLDLVLNDAIKNALYYSPLSDTRQMPWTMLTSIFVHGGILHIGLNMMSLIFIGPLLEQLVGRIRFIALYLIGGFGGSVAVLLIAPTAGVLGASGAIFALLGALFVIQRRLGGNSMQLLVLIGVNLAAGFFIGGISWQAHVGGLVAGAAVGLVYSRTRRRDQRGLQVALLAAVVAVLIAITIAAASRF